MDTSRSRILKSLIVVVGAGLITILFSLSDLGRKLEVLTIDYRFKLGGDKEDIKNVALVLMDAKSQKEFGVAPYSRRIFATLIAGLKKMEARVIGIDFRFEEPQSTLDDSLLCAAISNAGNVAVA